MMNTLNTVRMKRTLTTKLKGGHLHRTIHYVILLRHHNQWLLRNHPPPLFCPTHRSHALPPLPLLPTPSLRYSSTTKKPETRLGHYIKTLDSHIKSNTLDTALEIWTKATNDVSPDRTLYHLALKLFTLKKDLPRSLQLKTEMQSKQIPLSPLAYSNLVTTALHTIQPDTAHQLLLEMNDRGLSGSYRQLTQAMCALAKQRNLTKATELFHIMEKTNLLIDAFPYNILLGLIQDPTKAQQLFQQMKDNNIQPDNNSYSVLIRLLSRSHTTDAVTYYEEMKTTIHTLPENATMHHLLSGLINSNNFDLAVTYLKEMKKPDIVIYNLFLAVYVSKGNATKVKELIREIAEAKLSPAHATRAYLNKFSGFDVCAYLRSIGHSDTGWK